MPTAKKKSVATKSKASPAASSRYKKVLAGQWTGDLMLGSLFAEMLGTFVLTAAVLITSGSIIIAGLTVMILVLAMSRLTGAHVNPAVTVAMLVTRQISALRAGGYIVAQLFGAMLALLVVTQFVATAPSQVDPMTGQAASAAAFKVQALTGDWRPFFAEMLGAVVFGFGVAASVIGRKQGIDAGFTIGGSLLVGLLLASQASAAILNPAVAVGLSAYEFGGANVWTSIWVYALAPILGLSVGAWLYRLMVWDLSAGKKA